MFSRVRARGGVLSLLRRQKIESAECETIRRALQVSTLKRQAATLMCISPRALSYYPTKCLLIDLNRSHA